MSARLHVLLGAGGVGKTTLAAAYALSLAGQGRRVGLLGIDPARRLQSALGLSLDDEARAVPEAGPLRAAMLSPSQCLPRWAAEAAPDSWARLAENAFFAALAERLATANDVFAAIRMVEWAEQDPLLEDLVVDTAPGLNAIEFLRRPEALSVFLEGSLITWLRRLAPTRQRGFAASTLRGAAQRVIGGLARIGGSTFILELADFVALAERMLERMATRVTAARRWIADPSTEILLVAAVRDDAAQVARAMASALEPLGLSPRATLVNRALDANLGAELAALPQAGLSARASSVVRFAGAQATLQAQVLAQLAELAPIALPAVTGLEDDARLAPLRALGDLLSLRLQGARALASRADE